MNWSDLKLTPIEREDLELINEWQNIAELRDLVMGFRFPVQKEATFNWFDDITKTNSKSKIVYAIRFKNILVGVISLLNLDWLHRRANLGIFVANKQFRGSGIGMMSTSLLLDYSFNGLGLKKISTKVVCGNHAAGVFYKSLGFKKEGTLQKEYFLDGKFVDVEYLSLLDENCSISIPKEGLRLIGSLKID
jgi:RimJ/RimL family protein N-acetyltransferase